MQKNRIKTSALVFLMFLLPSTIRSQPKSPLARQCFDGLAESTSARNQTSDRHYELLHERSDKARKIGTLCLGVSTVGSAILAANQDNNEYQDVLKYGAPIVFGFATLGHAVYLAYNINEHPAIRSCFK